MLAGASFVLLGLLSFAISGPSPYLDVGYLIAGLLMLLGVAGLHAAQKESYGELGRVGSLAIVAAVIVDITVSFVVGPESLGWLSVLVALVGSLVLLVGFLALGSATLQAGVLPRWSGVALVALPLAFITDLVFGLITDLLLGVPPVRPGVFMMGLVWLAVGYALWSRREATAERPTRVS